MSNDKQKLKEKIAKIKKQHEDTIARNELMQQIMKCHDIGDYISAMYFLCEIKKYSGSKVWEIYYPKTLDALIAKNVNPDLYCDYLNLPAIEP